jgi:hypothetical protein
MRDDILNCNSNPPGRYGVQSVSSGPASAGTIAFVDEYYDQHLETRSCADNQEGL